MLIKAEMTLLSDYRNSVLLKWTIINTELVAHDTKPFGTKVWRSWKWLIFIGEGAWGAAHFTNLLQVIKEQFYKGGVI